MVGQDREKGDMNEGPSDLQRWLEGDKTAFERIVESQQAALLRFAAGMLRNRDAAQDIVQDTFIRLLDAAPGLRDGGALSAWLYRTCRNLAIDWIRKEKVMERSAREAGSESTSQTTTPSAAIEHRELVALVHDRMEKLTANQRDCIALKLVHGKSYKQISTITGLSVSNVGFQIHQGLKRLAAFVGAEGKLGGYHGV